MLLALHLVLHSPVFAQDIRAWQGMYEGRLMEAADSDTQQAIAWYRGLVEALPTDDPTRGELLYWLARALYSYGNEEEAMSLLGQLLDDPAVGARARALRSQMTEYEARIHTLPIHDDFLQGTGHWVRSWQHAERGDLAVEEAPGGDPALAWNTSVIDSKDDQIQVTLDLERDLQPQHFRFSIQSVSFTAMVLPALFDRDGHRYTLEQPILVPKEEWSAVSLSISDFLPLEGEGNRVTPRNIQAFVLQDVTAFYSSDRGSNTLFLGDVVIE